MSKKGKIKSQCEKN